jgi:hypothetical protein
MSALILAAVVLTTPMAAPPPTECRDLRPIEIRELRRRLAVNPNLRLDRQPQADLYRAVLRRNGRCDVVEVYFEGEWKKLPAGPMPEPRPANKGW